MKLSIFRWLLLALVLTKVVNAHVLTNIYLELEQESEQHWSGVIYFDAGYALPEMRADKKSPQPRRDWLVGGDEDAWKLLRSGAENYLRECLLFSVKGDGESLGWRMDFPDFEKAPPDFPRLPDGGAYFRIQLRGEIPVGTMQLAVRDGDYPNFTISLDGQQIRVVRPGTATDLMERTSKNLPVTLKTESSAERIWAFVILGYEHVVPKGWDHVLFILALFFLSAKWQPLLGQSLMFTLAHSVTLALAVGGVVYVPASVIEPLIALSIVSVAVENLFCERVGARRLLVVFAFGLIHGLGFAGVLGHRLGGQTEWLIPLIATNIGVELAQVTLLLAAFILFHRFAEKPIYGKIRYGASLAIGLTGLWWFVMRVAN